MEASAATRKAFTTFRREADPDDHYQSGEGAQATADKTKDDLEMSAVITIMQPILRFLQLLCENHNRDLQVRAGGQWRGRSQVLTATAAYCDISAPLLSAHLFELRTLHGSRCLGTRSVSLSRRPRCLHRDRDQISCSTV